MKTRSFSIFLLKKGYNAQNSLKPDHQLLDNFKAKKIPEGASLFISNQFRTVPWWVSYFSIAGDLEQESKGAIIFLPIKERCFALTFGHTYHNLLDISYEYDFGLKVTLNSLEPNELKSADIFDPGASRRKRTQVPVLSDLTYLDFDSNSEILKSLTGKVKQQYKELFKNATGSTSLKVGLRLEPDEILPLCEKLLPLYDSKEYLKSFPNIQNIIPEKDPDVINKLDSLLLEDFKINSDNLSLSIPDIIDYNDNLYCIFKGRQGKSNIYSDISLGSFYEYLGECDLNEFTIDIIKKCSLNICNDEGFINKAYNIYRSFIYDTKLFEDGIVYHLCEGEWYKINKNYLDNLNNFIDAKCEDTELPSYNNDNKDGETITYSEENYNKCIEDYSSKYICLDQTNISPDGFTQIEPCDIISYNENTCILHHIKISTRSSQLSHLFNQGVNSIELLILDKKSREKLKKLIKEKSKNSDLDNFINAIDKKNYKVVFGIITKKNANKKSDNLPLFSKISLMRSLKSLALYQTEGVVSFIVDSSVAKESYNKNKRVRAIVSTNEKGKNEVLVDNDQFFTEGKKIMGCSKEITNSPNGSKYMIYVKENENGRLITHHTWGNERV